MARPIWRGAINFGLVSVPVEANKAGIAKFVTRGKEYLAALRAGDGVLEYRARVAEVNVDG